MSISSSELGPSTHPFSRKRVLVETTGGGEGGPRVRGWGSPNSDDWRKSLALCLLCGLHTSWTENCCFDVNRYVFSTVNRWFSPPFPGLWQLNWTTWTTFHTRNWYSVYLPPSVGHKTCHKKPTIIGNIQKMAIQYFVTKQRKGRLKLLWNASKTTIFLTEGDHWPMHT